MNQLEEIIAALPAAITLLKHNLPDGEKITQARAVEAAARLVDEVRKQVLG